MSTASEIWEVMAEEIGDHERNPLEMFVARTRLHGVSILRRCGRPEPAPKPSARVEPPKVVPIIGFTLAEALAAEARGEGTVRFVNGVPQWTPRELSEPRAAF